MALPKAPVAKPHKVTRFQSSKARSNGFHLFCPQQTCLLSYKLSPQQNQIATSHRLTNKDKNITQKSSAPPRPPRELLPPPKVTSFQSSKARSNGFRPCCPQQTCLLSYKLSLQQNQIATSHRLKAIQKHKPKNPLRLSALRERSFVNMITIYTIPHKDHPSN